MKCKEYETKSGKPIRLWQGDCMELMEGKPENYWDLAIVDPPYGIGYDKIQNEIAGSYRTQNGGTWKKYHKTDWDANIPNDKYFNKLKSMSRNQIVWGGNFYNNDSTKCWLIWDKIQRDNRSDGEMAWTSFDKPMKIFRYSRADAYINNCDFKIHPTQKPVKLYRWLLQNYTEEGDTILDTHGGSMSLAIACYMEDYELDIIELDEDYYTAAVQRFEQHISQTTLF